MKLKKIFLNFYFIFIALFKKYFSLHVLKVLLSEHQKGRERHVLYFAWVLVNFCIQRTWLSHYFHHKLDSFLFIFLSIWSSSCIRHWNWLKNDCLEVFYHKPLVEDKIPSSLFRLRFLRCIQKIADNKQEDLKKLNENNMMKKKNLFDI